MRLRYFFNLEMGPYAIVFNMTSVKRKSCNLFVMKVGMQIIRSVLLVYDSNWYMMIVMIIISSSTWTVVRENISKRFFEMEDSTVDIVSYDCNSNRIEFKFDSLPATAASVSIITLSL